MFVVSREYTTFVALCNLSSAPSPCSTFTRPRGIHLRASAALLLLLLGLCAYDACTSFTLTRRTEETGGGPRQRGAIKFSKVSSILPCFQVVYG